MKKFNLPNIMAMTMVALYVIPFLTSISLPFSYWDWLTLPEYQMRGIAYSWRSFPGNIIFTFLHDTVQFRPVSVAINNLEYLVFKGEFWLWYVFKWFLFSSCIFLIYKTIKNITKKALPACVAAIYFGLHPMPFVIDLMSQDGFVCFFALGSLYFLSARIPENKKFSQFIEWMTPIQYLFFIFVATLAILSKEIGIAFAIFVISMIFFGNEFKFKRNFLLKIIPFFTIVLFTAWKISKIHHPTSHLDSLISGKFSELLTQLEWPIGRTCSYLLPNSPLDSLYYLSALIIISGLITSIFSNKDYAFVIISLITGLCVSIFIISVAYPCPKYLPVPVMFVALLLGISISALLNIASIISNILSIVFIALMYSSSPGQIYSQWLGMTQSLYELSDIVNFMEKKDKENYSLRWSDIGENDLPHEKGYSLEIFFKKYAVRWYGYDHPIDLQTLKSGGVPADQRFVLLSSITPSKINDGKLANLGVPNLSELVGVYSFGRERFGVLEQATGWLKKWNEKMDISLVDPIDCASPQPSRFAVDMPNPIHDIIYYPQTAGPHFLYVFDPKQANHSNSMNEDIISIPPLRRYGAFGR